MNCKIVTATELPQVMALWDYCFEKEDDPFFQWYFREYCIRHNLILGGFSEEDGHLQNMLHMNPYSILLRGQEEHVPQMPVFFGKTAQHYIVSQAVFLKIPPEKRLLFLFKTVIPQRHYLGQLCCRYYFTVHGSLK